ncbi:accessory gene regulator B [Paenibacillus forsythiae]|uniref:Accessory gene regulator B n=1 Tax=Paenibacillus forsythiae TaxID=365616 RepID=A0ABU3H9J8_9BACL|nr:accessory gene regulator B family protein [Paenibacillus forsythiae]MDT3427498.1 accessory gene regulator B [Paenibacillus forsythiae]
MNIMAHKIACAIKRANPEQTSSVEVMQYALQIILNTLLIFVMSILLASLTGNIRGAVLTFSSLALLRIFSGGFHLKTARACNLFSTLLCVIIPLLSEYLENYLLYLNLTSLLLAILFAPNPDINTQINKKWYPALKLLSVLLISTNFLIYSPVIGLAFFIQSLTIIPFERRWAR